MIDLLDADADVLRRVAEEDLAAARAALSRFKALPADADALSVARGYDAIGWALDRSAGLAHLLFMAHPSQATRECAGQVSRDYERFGTETSLDPEVYGRLQAVDLEQARHPGSRRLIEHALRDYRRAGVDRDEATRGRIASLRGELVELGQSFGRRIAEDVRHIELDGPQALAGLPHDFVKAHPPDARGRVTISTDPPDLLPFLRYADDRPARLALRHAALQRGAPGNLAVLDRLIAARHELATLLGHASWAAYVTEDKMIGSDEAAAEFIERVSDLAAAKAERERQLLEDELHQLCGPDAVLRDADRLYLTQRLRSRLHGFDAREMRPYLAFDAVLDGVFDTIRELYGLQLVACPEQRAWHPDVATWELRENGRPLARFLLDLHPRPEKFKHAAMFPLCTGALPCAALVCNLPRPGGDQAALLDPDQVTTLFHEFGHLLHHLLAGRQEWHAFAGIATEWDFVEVPSQLFEEWPRDARVLSRFARHHETVEPVPDELVARMNAAAACGRGLEVRGQMFLAAYSLECFRRDPEGLDTAALLEELKPRYVPYPVEPDTAFQASFGHLDGYSALYYTYMWSLSLAKDCWSRFREQPMDRETARHYRRALLEPGGSQDAEELLRGFLGRPPRLDAFEAWLGA